MAKRNKLEIIKDILNIIQENRSIKPTPLLRKSNLSSSRFKEYYSELLQKEFTKKGREYLEKYFVIISFIDEFEL